MKEAKALLEKHAELAQEYPELKQVSLQELTQRLKKMDKHRESDWECQRCQNRNYAFRH